MKSIKGLILFFLLFASSQSFAWYHLELGIGYNRGHYQTNKVQGIGLVAKAGFTFGKLFIVGDVGQHDLQLGGTPTSTLMDTSLTIGGNFNAWRFWYSHMLSASLTTESGGTEVETTGDGSKVGISGKINKNMYLNFEGRFIDFTEQDGSPTSQFMDAAFLSITWVWD